MHELIRSEALDSLLISSPALCPFGLDIRM